MVQNVDNASIFLSGDLIEVTKVNGDKITYLITRSNRRFSRTINRRTWNWHATGSFPATVVTEGNIFMRHNARFHCLVC